MSDSCILATVKCSGSFDLQRLNIKQDQLFQIFTDVHYCDCAQELTITSEKDKEKQWIVVKYCKNISQSCSFVEGKYIFINFNLRGAKYLIITYLQMLAW